MIPTAEEFLKEDNTSDDTLAIADVMVRFAKLHVKKALEFAAYDYNEGSPEAVREAIIESYPLTLIK